jgi:Ca2+-binding RTX toxin-like protein
VIKGQVEGSSHGDTFINNGLFSEGNVNLKDGNDVYDARGGGTITGNNYVLFGEGDDFGYAGDSAVQFQGGAGKDDLTGGAGSDFITGDNGDDVLRRGVGQDDLRGGANNDTIEGGVGADTIDAGIDFDFVWYHSSTEALTISLIAGATQKGGEAEGDTLTGIEGVIGGYGDDYVTANHLDNVLNGGGTSNGTDGGNDFLDGNSGNDHLNGEGGNDTLMGGLGTDTLLGGKGYDKADYWHSSEAVTVNLSTGTGAGGQAEGDVLQDIENIRGSLHGDKLVGDDKANALSGEKGDDTLEGGGGEDVLFGGEGRDVAVFRGNASDYTVAYTASTVIVTDERTQQSDTLHSVEVLEFTDKTVETVNTAPSEPSLDKTIVAEDALTDTIVAEVSAKDSNGDDLTFTLTNDAEGRFKLDGKFLILAKPLDYETDPDHDIAVQVSDGRGGFSSKTFTIQVGNVAEPDTGGGTGGGGGGTGGSGGTGGTGGSGGTGGTGGGNPTEQPLILIGTRGPDRLTGAGFNDVIKGLGGRDVLSGEGGNDKLYGGAGKDVLTGGAGGDVFVFDVRPHARHVDTLRDFSRADDTIHLVRKAFSSKIGKKGVLKKDAFVVSSEARDAEDRIIYNKNKGLLSFDRDGTGDADAVVFAKVKAKTKIGYDDFMVL